MRPECWTQLPHTRFGVQEMGGGHTQGTLLVVSTREERKEQEGLKINVFVLPY